MTWWYHRLGWWDQGRKIVMRYLMRMRRAWKVVFWSWLVTWRWQIFFGWRFVSHVEVVTILVM